VNISLLLVVILVTNYYFHFVDDESHCLVMRETCMAVGAGMEDSTELVVCVCVCVMCIMAGGAGMEDSMELVVCVCGCWCRNGGLHGVGA